QFRFGRSRNGSVTSISAHVRIVLVKPQRGRQHPMTQTPDPNAMPRSKPAPAGPPPGPMGYTPPSAPPDGPIGYAPPPAMAPKKSNRLALGILAILAIVVVGGIVYAVLTRDSSSGAVDALQ